ncbi:hypothetical protein DH2020_022377 [Rehmannia glutinosa]|uniref:Ferroxidase n=1 Tax=Rehmannia glutinosa TaxID=99300 RepID=A0ABR0WGZ2_REHGL
MLLKAAPAFGLLNSHGENLSALFSAASSSSFPQKNSSGRNGCVLCMAKHTNSKPLTGVVFEPFEEVKKELMLVPSVPQDSLARQKYSSESEAAINEQIKSNKRGGKVKLQSILMPLSEFEHAEKGDALYAMELALSLEKLTNEKLLNLHAVESIKKISEYVAQLRRVGKGHGVWHFDQMLLQ